MKSSKLISFGKFLRKYLGNNIFLGSIDNICEFLYNRYKRGNIKTFPNIFIIGPPGSGTTIVYQILIKEFNLGYLSNLINVFYGLPFLLSLFSKNKILKNNFELKSKHGYIKGLHSPSEIGPLNKLWFEYFHKKNIQKKLLAINNIYGKPLVIKNTQNTLRTKQIYDSLPNCLFVYVSREKYFNAQSIYLNKDNYSHVDRFYSKAYNNIINDNYLKKAIDIINYSNKIKEKLKTDIPQNIIEIQYEDFIKNPDKYINSIYSWFLKRGVKLDRTGHTNLVSLKLKNKNKLDYANKMLLQKLINNNN
jgi:hypothetical protein